MQVVCGNCQLSFDAPDGATGLVCPICRGPLHAKAGDGGATGTARPTHETVQEWSGGDLDDLIGILSVPAASARVQVLPPDGDNPVGEVHLLAGGVSDALFAGKSSYDALDKLRAIKPARFRIEPRLPNPSDGDLANPGPDAGTLESRALAHLMRYCEDYVITGSIEVWRGNENARVEYKRGEISGVTVGGIDAPERLAEVMQWSSGNYRLVVPALDLPAVAPKRAQPAVGTPAPVPAPAASAQAARQVSATKTMFGIPLADLAKAKEAAAAVSVSAKASAPIAAAPPAVAKTMIGTMPQAVSSTPASAAPTPAAAAPAASTSPAPAPTPATAQPIPNAASKTMFGIPAPSGTEGFPSTAAAPVRPAPQAVSAAAAAAPMATDREAAATSARAEADRKMGARKVSVPAPDVGPPPAALEPTPAPAPAAVAHVEAAEPIRRAPAAPAALTRVETTEPVKRLPPQGLVEKPASSVGPVLAWALVGVFFGAVFLAVYYFVGQLGH